MRKLIFYISLLLCVTSCTQPQHQEQKRTLPFYNSADFTPQWIEKTSAAYANIHRIPAFSFTDQQGQPFTEQNVSGKIYVADFFFTSCPGICKSLTRNMREVQTAFKQDSNVLLLSHSVTPEADSVPVLSAYAERFGVKKGKWFLLTGDHDALYTLARQAYFADEDLGLQKTPNEFLHTENILLIDKQRRIRGVYKGISMEAIRNLIADIHILEEEK